METTPHIPYLKRCENTMRALHDANTEQLRDCREGYAAHAPASVERDLVLLFADLELATR